MTGEEADHSSSSSRTGSAPSSREGSIERRQPPSQALSASDRLKRESSSDRLLSPGKTGATAIPGAEVTGSDGVSAVVTVPALAQEDEDDTNSFGMKAHVFRCIRIVTRMIIMMLVS